MFVIEIFCKYDWAVPLKDKRSIRISDTFQQFQLKIDAKHDLKNHLVKAANLIKIGYKIII